MGQEVHRSSPEVLPECPGTQATRSVQEEGKGPPGPGRDWMGATGSGVPGPKTTEQPLEELGSSAQGLRQGVARPPLRAKGRGDSGSTHRAFGCGCLTWPPGSMAGEARVWKAIPLPPPQTSAPHGGPRVGTCPQVTIRHPMGGLGLTRAWTSSG